MDRELQEKNLQLFFKKLDKLGINTGLLQEKYGEKLLSASFVNTNEFGNAYDGSFLEIILRVLTPYAINLNNLLPEGLRVDPSSLVKVCLLHQIAKSIMMVKNTNEWEINKLNKVYTYAPDLPALKTGLLSMHMATECGVSFTIDEVEAMTINDRVSTDTQAKFFSNRIANIVRMANEMTYLQINS